MKKFIAILLVALMAMSLCAINTSAESTVLVERASTWEYVVFDETDIATATPEGWLDGTDSATWAEGTAPFRDSLYSYPANNNGTNLEKNAFSLFVRKTFTVEDASAVTSLVMDVIYDQDPVVYINGTQVWTATGWHDADYVVDVVLDASVLKDGENVVCAAVHNPAAGGGGVFDLSLTASSELTDENGNYLASSVTNTGFSDFGSINAPTNVLDGDQNTCTGSNFNAEVEQAVIFTLVKPGYVDSVFVQCKDEGTTTNEDGTRGTYDIYAINGETATKIAENVPAVTGTDGGYTVNLEESVKAEAIKVVITSWQGDCWACVADMTVHKGEAPAGGGDVETGDVTVVIAALAVVALFGTAVIVKKVHD